MSNINNISTNGTLSSANRVDARNVAAPRDLTPPTTSAPSERRDAVDISPAAQRLSAISGDENTFRPDLVERIRSEIADGTYDADARLDIALDRLIDRVIAEG